LTKRKLVDAMCADLAKHFMGDFRNARAEDETELAEAIQSVCEDFCAALESECICRGMIVNRECPVHGSPRDPDAEYEAKRDREAT
jgi:hypothetical protein